MNSFSPSVAVVGLGGFARTHLTLLSSLQAADCCNIVAIADPFANHDEDVVCAFEQSGTRLFSSLEKLLGEVQPEAVFIATPIHLHEQQTVAALNAGCHVYVEKPPCATLAEWHRMKAAQDNANRRCEVGFLLQSSSSMQFLRRKLCEGVIGKVQQVWTGVRWSRNDNYYARSSWAGHWQIDDTPVFDGPATNALAHAVQTALGLAASTPSSMPLVRQARGAIWRARPIESYDTAFLDIETTDDVAIRLVFTHATSFSDEVVMRVKGEQGTAAITWNGQVTLHPEGKEEQQFKFLQQPALSAFVSFLQSIAHTEHVTQTPLEHT
ncbi:MAG: Gfo/Idh/MocA family oxidoreductase, partial [Abditibacteriaceae bacterium]